MPVLELSKSSGPKGRPSPPVRPPGQLPRPPQEPPPKGHLLARPETLAIGDEPFGFAEMAPGMPGPRESEGKGLSGNEINEQNGIKIKEM